jgi:molybdopterin molybdotransferase
MHLQTPDVPLTDLAAARARLLGFCAPVAAREAQLARVEEGFLAEDLRAPVDLPVCALAARDGFACASADLVGASAFAPAYLARAPHSVEIGAPMPEGCDCVLDADHVEREGALVVALHAAAPGEGVTRAGDDAQAGDVLARAGERINAARAALLHAAGVRSASLRRPAVRILVAPHAAGASSAALVCALAQAEGARVDLCVAAGRSLEDLRGALDPAGVDALVCVGGTGAGESDAMIAALRARGADPLLHGLALSPGASGAAGLFMGTPVLALPGRPEAAFAVWLALGGPMIRALAGAREPAPLEAAPLARKIASAPGLCEIVLVEQAEGLWSPCAPSLAGMARAQGFLLTAAGSEGFAAGALVAPASLPLARG